MISCVAHQKLHHSMAGGPSRVHKDTGKILAEGYVEEDKEHWSSSIG